MNMAERCHEFVGQSLSIDGTFKGQKLATARRILVVELGCSNIQFNPSISS